MWTGVSQKRIATGKIELDNSTVKNSLLDFLRKEVIQPRTIRHADKIIVLRIEKEESRLKQLSNDNKPNL